MKTNAKILILALCMCCSGVFLSASNFSLTENSTIKKNFLMEVFGTYSWNAVFGAVDYSVDLENVATFQTFHFETNDTSVSLNSIPSGTYTITVKAHFADGSSYIIIVEDFVI